MANLCVQFFLHVKLCFRTCPVRYYFHGHVYAVCEHYSKVHECSHLFSPPPYLRDRIRFPKFNKRGCVNLRFSIKMTKLAKRVDLVKGGMPDFLLSWVQSW